MVHRIAVCSAGPAGGGGSRVTLGLGHAKASCPGSSVMGIDTAFSGKGSTARLTKATSHHLPPGVTCPTNFSCKRQGCCKTRNTNRRRVRPRLSAGRQLRGPRRATRGRTHLAAAGRRTGDCTPGSRDWLRPSARRFVSPLRKAFPAPRQPVGFAHCTTTGLMSQRQAPGSCPLPQSREPGRGPSPSCGFSVHPAAVSGERFYLGAGSRV